MKQEEKELLIKDLCARLPYGVKAFVKNWSNLERIWIEGIYTIKSIYPSVDSIFVSSNMGSVEVIVEDDDYKIKPYLFPMSSMTEEQRNEYHELLYNPKHGIDIDYFDWCHKNHLDCRCLIKKGLALDATNLNIDYGSKNKM